YIYGVKNTAGYNSEASIDWEKSGTPGVLLATEFCNGQTYRHAMSAGVPIRSYELPCEKWFAEEEVDEFISLAENSIEDIIRSLTDPLTDEEKNPKPFEYDISDVSFEGEDYTDAYDKFQTYFIENKFTDGMSVAPPTPDAVKKMLTGTSRRPDEVIFGEMTPARGIVTIEKIAINAVMAGAKPEYLPVIITAVEMLCDPDFDAFHPLATITSPQLLIAVGGPIAKEIGMNCKTGYLGPGTRANSTIGRAVSLSVINLGWLDFDIDAGMTGQPSRYCNLTMCENDEDSPWEPFHVSKGYSAQDSTVTIEEILLVDGYWWADPAAYMPSGSVWTYGPQADLDRIAEKAVGATSSLEGKLNPVHNINAVKFFDKVGLKEWFGGHKYALIIYPGQARQLAALGYTRESLTKYIGDYRRLPWESLTGEVQENILKLAQSGELPGLSVDDCKAGGTIPVFDTDKLAIFVSGPMNGQTLGLTYMGTYKGRYGNPPKSPFFIKKITGATLTNAGR
ncbi:MAG: hypothetical protein GX847_07680, partial [Clostridiales bacterium]|nr:hypothetical protein [Clostridiales bacterium]